MSKTRRCPYCQRSFLPSLYRPQQEVCGEAKCQRRRRTDYHRKKIANDPEYHQVVLDSQKKWRARHPDYDQQRRQANPKLVETNRERQRQRWCWRCKAETPMLDDNEYRRVTSRPTNERGKNLQERFAAMLAEYEKITGFRETNPNAIWHHRLSIYGPPCRACGKPLRTPQAKVCGSCMKPVADSPYTNRWSLSDIDVTTGSPLSSSAHR